MSNVAVLCCVCSRDRDLAFQDGERATRSARDLEARLHTRLQEADKREVPPSLLAVKSGHRTVTTVPC